MGKELTALLDDILCGSPYFVGGVQKSSTSLPALLAAVVQWGTKLHRPLEEIVAVVEPCLRQSILMSLLPAEVFDSGYAGSIDAAIDRHLHNIEVTLTDTQKRTVRDLCINARKLRGMTKEEARRQVMSFPLLRGRPKLYKAISERQRGRCIWCGVDLALTTVQTTLEHVTPYHLGDDPVNGTNWALACASCNTGKADTLAWAAQSSAHDFFTRTDFVTANRIPLPQRWTVLMRTRQCVFCGKQPIATELWIYRRIATGIAIPAHCSATCVDCARTEKLEILLPRWVPSEGGRGQPKLS
jgi:hypothetical protein